MSADNRNPDGRASEQEGKTEFERMGEMSDPGIVREFVDFLKTNKKWWLTPILIATVLMVGLVVLSSSPVAPFIYTLF